MICPYCGGDLSKDGLEIKISNKRIPHNVFTCIKCGKVTVLAKSDVEEAVNVKPIRKKTPKVKPEQTPEVSQETQQPKIIKFPIKEFPTDTKKKISDSLPVQSVNNRPMKYVISRKHNQNHVLSLINTKIIDWVIAYSDQIERLSLENPTVELNIQSMVDTICKSISIKPENIKTEEEFKEYVAQLSGVILHAQVLLAKSIEEMVYNGNIFAKVWMLPPYKQLIDFDDELFEIQARNRGIDKEDVNDDEFPDDEDDEFEDDDDEDEWD